MTTAKRKNAAHARRIEKDADRLMWIKSQLDRGTDIQITREMAELDDDTRGLCFMVWAFPQSGTEQGCGKFVSGNTDFRGALDDARRVLAKEV